MIRTKPMTAFWLLAWASFLSIGWLLPNHYAPWSAFHIDAYIAVGLLLGAAATVMRSPNSVEWHGIALLAATLVFIPGLQYACGLVMLPGTAWIATAYLFGFVVALLVGAHWESASPGQLVDGLFLAIGIAAIVSVGLQLDQYLDLDLSVTWIIENSTGRPFANIGQPNQLGTFLLWGLLAAAWGLVRKYIGLWTALLAAIYLLFGIALTQSRTAWLAVAMLTGGVWIWRRLWIDKRTVWIVTGLGIYFVVCVLSIAWIAESVGGGAGWIARTSSELRPLAWLMFFDALWQHPLAGYGWNQLALAQLTVATNHPVLHTLFFHSHNLFLDLVLWCGIPIGLLVSLFLVLWFWQRIRAVNCPESAVLMFFLMVVANHAMLEFPLHYAYLLLPTGIIMGVLNVRLHAKAMLITGRWSLVVIWMVAAAFLTQIIRDYSRVETAYEGMRIEWAHIKYEGSRDPPDVVFLTQLRDFIRLARFEPRTGMGVEELNWVRNITSTYPSSAAIYKLASALAMNGQPEESIQWLRRMCKVESESHCEVAKAAWASLSLQNPLIAAVPWPK